MISHKIWACRLLLLLQFRPNHWEIFLDFFATIFPELPRLVAITDERSMSLTNKCKPYYDWRKSDRLDDDSTWLPIFCITLINGDDIKHHKAVVHISCLIQDLVLCCVTCNISIIYKLCCCVIQINQMQVVPISDVWIIQS